MWLNGLKAIAAERPRPRKRGTPAFVSANPSTKYAGCCSQAYCTSKNSKNNSNGEFVRVSSFVMSTRFDRSHGFVVCIQFSKYGVRFP